MVVDLLSADQVFELLESGEGSVLENFGSHIDPLEEIVQLFCSSPGIPLRLEFRQMFPNFLEGNPIASIVRAR